MHAARPLLPLLLAAIATACANAGRAQPPLPTRVVEVGGAALRVELADTESQRRRGLSHRTGLEPERGMLFRYAVPTRPRFKVRDMRFPLDILWIRGGIVREITRAVPPGIEDHFVPREPVDHVLEVPAGTVERRGWRVGTPFRPSVPSPPTPR